MAEMWGAFADAQARVGRPGGFGPRPTVWRAIVTRWLRGVWRPNTLRGRGVGPAFRKLLEGDPWTRVIPHRPSVSVTFSEVRLCRYFAWFFDHLHSHPSHPLVHVSGEGVPSWLAEVVRRVAPLIAPRTKSEHSWPRRRDTACVQAVAFLLGISPRTFKEKVRAWREERARWFWPDYAATNSSEERTRVLRELQALLDGDVSRAPTRPAQGRPTAPD